MAIRLLSGKPILLACHANTWHAWIKIYVDVVLINFWSQNLIQRCTLFHIFILFRRWSWNRWKTKEELTQYKNNNNNKTGKITIACWHACLCIYWLSCVTFSVYLNWIQWNWASRSSSNAVHNEQNTTTQSFSWFKIISQSFIYGQMKCMANSIFVSSITWRSLVFMVKTKAAQLAWFSRPMWTKQTTKYPREWVFMFA